MTIAPSILLVRPQMGENIGAAARAMANFGLTQMQLVAPRDGWPNPRACDTAGKALDILDDATLHPTTEDALANAQYVLATTSRARANGLPTFTMAEAMQLLRNKTASGQCCTLMFGPERTGLENEDIALADGIVHIPVSTEYPSLNLGQAVVIAGYAWLEAAADAPAIPAGTTEAPATREQLQGLLDDLESRLDGVNFWRVAEKKPAMWRNLRATLIRTQFTPQEIATWRGMLRALQENRPL